MNAAWQLQQGALQRASIMYAASLRNSFTHLTQGPLCCCHEIKLYVCIVSFLDPLHTARFTAPLCTCMHTRSHKPLYYCSASIFQVKWMYQYNCHIHNGPWLLLFAIKKFLFLTARLFWSKSGKLKEKERVNQPTLFQFFFKMAALSVAYTNSKCPSVIVQPIWCVKYSYANNGTVSHFFTDKW